MINETHSLFHSFSIILATILCCEIFFKISLIKNFKELIKLQKNSISIIKSDKISDHWKEKIVVEYAKKIAISAVKVPILLIIIFLPLILWLTIFKNLSLETTSWFLTSMELFLITISSIFYFIIRKYRHG